MSMSVSGEENLKKLMEIEAKLNAALNEAAHWVGQTVQKQAVDGITRGGHSGRLYTTYFRTRGTGAGRQIFPVGERAPHQASAPGEYSANDSGALAGSIQYKVQGVGYVLISANAHHAGYQEFGTDKIAPRPNIAKAIEESSDLITSYLGEIVWRAL